MKDRQISGAGSRQPSQFPRRPAPRTEPKRKVRPPQPDIVPAERRREEYREEPRTKRGRSRNRWFRAIVMVMGTVAGCIFLALFILQSAYDFFGLNQRDQLVEVTIPEGVSIRDLSRLLRENGVLEQSFPFRVYAGIKATGDEIRPGEYILNSNMGYTELLLVLTSGRTTKEVVRLTFIEGSTLLDIAKQLQENKVCNAEAFIDYLRTADYNYDFFNAIENSPLRFHRLEGYLFPDTYDFFVGENVDSVARKFIRNFNDKLTPDLKSRMQDLNMTIDETITLASVIQKEAGLSEDMRLVSSVFHNRLRNSVVFSRLQSDVTIFYVEDDIKPLLQRTNQDMYDAYNTYVCEGLPIGPICNPGLNAIRAALYPEITEFYFFVTDINMDFYYSRTAEDHYRNVAIARQVGGEAHGIATR